MDYPTEVYADLNRTLPGLPTAGPGFESIEVDPLDVPICSGPAHPRKILMTTQTLTGEWYCRHCEPERANRARELTLRTVAAALEIRRRLYWRRQQNDEQTNGANDGK
jgi:hypothetical protein